MSHVTSVDTRIVSFHIGWAELKLATMLTEQVNSSLRIGNSLCSIQYPAQTRVLRVPAKIEPVFGRSRWPRFSGCSFFRGAYFTRSFTFRYASRYTLQRAVPIVSDFVTNLIGSTHQPRSTTLHWENVAIAGIPEMFRLLPELHFPMRGVNNSTRVDVHVLVSSRFTV